MNLRAYQQKCIVDVRKSIKAGNNRVMVFMPTGAGKTVIFIEQIIRAMLKGGTVLVLTRRRQIVIQTARRIVEALKRLDMPTNTVGVYMAGSKDINLITVSSIDTVVRKKDLPFKGVDVVIVDEAHDCTSDGYVKVLDKLKCKYVIGYTATPFRIGRKGHKFWQDVVHPVSTAELRDKGFLVPTKIFCPSKPDLSGVNVVNGDYNQAKLHEAMNQTQVYGDIVRHYKKLSDYRPAICFCVNIEHSKAVAEAFNEAGITAFHVDADTPQKERDELIARFKKNHSSQFVLCNVNVFSTGVDIPHVKTLILARPTKSLVLYLQQIGRGLRPVRGKEDCLILDHAGNCLRFGDPFNTFTPQLEDLEKGERSKDAPSKFKDCRFCHYMLPLSAKVCTACGQDVRTFREIKLDSSANLVEFKGNKYTQEEFTRKAKAYKAVLSKKLNYPPSWVQNKMRRVYGKSAHKIVDSLFENELNL